MDVMEGAILMSGGILDSFQTIIPTAAAVLSERRQMLRMTQQEVADQANITLRQYQRLESGERNILTSSFGLACRVIEALDMDVSKFYHGDYYLEEEVKTMRGKGIASRKKTDFLLRFPEDFFPVTEDILFQELQCRCMGKSGSPARCNFYGFRK